MIEMIDGVWVFRDMSDYGRITPITCGIRIVDNTTDGASMRAARTCGKPATYRAMTGTDDGSGQSYDERFCCADCKAADEKSGRYYLNGVLVEDYGPMYQYEEIVAEAI